MYLNPEEFADVQELADRCGVSKTTLIKMLIADAAEVRS